MSRLFGRRHQSDVAESSPFMVWTGQSGKEYQFEIYPIETEFRALPGVYVYAKQTEDGGWIPLYMAQTRDMHQRLEGHEKLQDSLENGATHIHMHYCDAGQASRCTEERDLVLGWRPQFNTLPES